MKDFIEYVKQQSKIPLIIIAFLIVCLFLTYFIKE